MEKIQEICEMIKAQTLEPAKEQARQIIENAKIEAENIKKEAEKKSKNTILKVEEEIKHKERAYRSSLVLALRQSIETLKQELEKHFFNENLLSLVRKELSDKDVLKKLIDAAIEALKNNGIHADFNICLSDEMAKEDLSLILAKDIFYSLKEKIIFDDKFKGGIKIKLHKEQLEIDFTDEVIKDLILRYIREDFRKIIFQE